MRVQMLQRLLSPLYQAKQPNTWGRSSGPAAGGPRSRLVPPPVGVGTISVAAQPSCGPSFVGNRPRLRGSRARCRAAPAPVCGRARGCRWPGLAPGPVPGFAAGLPWPGPPPLGGRARCAWSAAGRRGAPPRRGPVLFVCAPGAGWGSVRCGDRDTTRSRMCQGLSPPMAGPVGPH